jgi:capsular polysaccharide biosynthesis protein
MSETRVSEEKRSSLAEFYHCRLRPYGVIRLPKEAIWTAVWFTRWKILRPVAQAAWTMTWFTRWKILSPVALAVRTMIWFTRWKILRPVAQAVWTARWYIRWKILRPAALAVIPRASLRHIHMFKAQGAAAMWRRWRDPGLPLVSLTAAATSQAGKVEILSAPERVPTPPPGVHPKESQSFLPPARNAYEFPSVVVAELFDAEVSGHSNLVRSNGVTVHHDLYTFSHDFTSEEMHGKIRIYPQRNIVKHYVMPEIRHNLDVAALFTDSCSPNYAHWLTEVLPRINLFCRTNPDVAIPLIVDAGLHANLEESLHAVAGDKAEIIRLGSDDAARVKRLFITSPTGYIPFERRGHAESGHSHGIFSPYALASMRKHLGSVLEKPVTALTTRVFLRRNSLIRSMRNEQQLEEKLVSLGFSAIEPERLSFAQQFHLFANAEVIVGATGAGLANLVFCSKSTRVIICISTHPEHSYGYWQNMAAALGNKVNYVFGPTVGPAAHGVHADFRVDVDAVVRAIEQ